MAEPTRRALLAAIAGAGLWPGRGAGAAAPVRARQIADTAWFVQGEAALGSPANRNFISNAGFVVTDEGVLVVDALGSPVLADELIAEIGRITPQPIRYLVVTHYHADHIYGLQRFQAAGAAVLAHAGARLYLQSDAAQQRLAISRQQMAPWIDAHTRLVPADRWLQGDTVLALGAETFHIRHAGPSHTPEDLVVHAQRAGVLFAGDLVFRGRIPFVGQADSRRWIDALDRLLQFQPRVMVPGHGPLSTAPADDLRFTRDYLLHLRQAMAEAAARMEPFDEAYARADWSRYQGLPLFDAANRMNAYNTYLLLEQQVLEAPGRGGDKP